MINDGLLAFLSWGYSVLGIPLCVYLHALGVSFAGFDDFCHNCLLIGSNFSFIS